jgi:hypothetical protein
MRLAASAVLLLAVCARADADSHPAGSQTAPAATGVAVGAGAATGATKMLVLVFPSTYPYCKLSYADGTPYAEIVINDYQCDYLHATVQTDTGADKFFNALPTFDAQTAFLRDVESAADDAHTRYMFAIVDAARQNDPAKAPKAPPEKRLAALMALSQKFSTAAIAAAPSRLLWKIEKRNLWLLRS